MGGGHTHEEARRVLDARAYSMYRASCVTCRGDRDCDSMCAFGVGASFSSLPPLFTLVTLVSIVSIASIDHCACAPALLGLRRSWPARIQALDARRGQGPRSPPRRHHAPRPLRALPGPEVVSHAQRAPCQAQKVQTRNLMRNLKRKLKPKCKPRRKP